MLGHGQPHRRTRRPWPPRVRRHGRSAGKMVNLMSSDTEGLQSALQGLWNAWSAPIRIIVALILLYGQLSWATFLGVFILGISIPVQKRFVMKLFYLFAFFSVTTQLFSL